METLFFQILCYGAPGMLAAQSLETFYSGRGKSWVVMLVDAWAVLVNLVLACVLVLGWGGVESWGVAGAAWATVIAQWWRVAVYATLMLMPANRETFHTSEFAPDWKMIRRIIRFGGPSGVQMMLDVGGFAVFMMLVNELGISEAAATSVAFRISQLAFMPVWGFGMATAVLVGQKLGEDRPDLAQRATHTALTMCVAYMGTISLMFVLVPRLFLLVFFEHGAELSTSGIELASVEAIAVRLMRFVAAYNLLDACIIIYVSVLRGAGDTRFVMKVSMFMATSLAAGTWLGVGHLGWNIYGAWWYITIWLWAVAGIYYLRYRAGHWKSMRVIDQVHGHLPELISVEPASPSAT
jgi:MATE family multidrug resistance protein